MTRLFALCVVLAACTPAVPLATFPATPHPGPTELEAEMPAARKVFAESYPKFEILQFASTGDDWVYGRNEISGSVIRRGMEANVQFRYGGQCYYTRPYFVEEHVDAAWGPPHLLDLGFLPNGHNHITEWVENVKVTRMASCDPATGTTTAVR